VAYPPIILASSSPRRRELLGLTGLEFTVRPAAADETPGTGETPEDYVRRMSATKVEMVAANAAVGAVVVGADTIVVVDDEPAAPSILGKPRDAAQAVGMLQRLRARHHRVLTALSVIDTAAHTQQHDLVSAQVPMRAYGDDEIQAYVASGNPLDKAGAYAIQFPAFQPVDRARFADCFATVMGLPVCSLLRLLGPAVAAARLGRPPADCHHFHPAACPIYGLIEKD
jgi:septum formation protein